MVGSETKWWILLLFPLGMVVIAMFMSEYNHSIDAKGRLIIPSKFRETLGDEFVVSKGLDGCLFVYTIEDWKVIADKITSFPMSNKEARKFARFLLPGAVQVEVDKQGRILLPVKLREYAELEKDVTLVGVGGRIEIWNSEKWENISEDGDMDSITEALEAFGLTI